MYKYVFFLLSCLLCTAVSAEVLKGRVVDKETDEPLEGVQLNVTEVIPGKGKVSAWLVSDAEGGYTYRVNSPMSNITVTARFLGYFDGTLKRMGMGTKDTIRVEDIRLRPREELLKEFNVQARVKRFYMRGDTVVFNPQAFNMESGDRLIALVMNLPGVSMKDNKLLWNNKPLTIMMNGKNALDEAMLLNQLPVEAVEKIKAYDKASELQERTGVADGNEKPVLDIQIKPGFMDRFYTSAKAKAYAAKEYAAQLEATRLSDEHPFMLFGRVADDPEKVDSRTIGGMNLGSSNLPIRQQAGALAYRHLWRPDYEVKYNSHWDVSANVNHTDESTEGWKHQQTFLPGTQPTQSNSTDRSYHHILKAPLDFGSYLNVGTRNTLRIEANLAYKREMRTSDTEQETFETEEGQMPVNASAYHASSRTEGITLNGRAGLTHYFKGGSLTGGVSVNYDHTENEGNSLGTYQYYQQGTSLTDKQHYTSPRHNLKTAWTLDVNKAIGQNIMAHALWETRYDSRYQDEERWRADMLDRQNSVFRDDDGWQNALTLDANFNAGRFMAKPVLRLTHQQERSDYRRATLDTLVLRRLFIVAPSLEMNYRFQKQMGLQGTFSYTTRPADLIDCIGYVDDTNPLYVRMGNPDLKASHTLDAGVLYNLMLARHSQSLFLSVNCQKTYDPVGTVLHYNSDTGVYHARKQNVRGGNNWNMQVTYERSLTDDLQMKNTTTGSFNRSYGVLTLVDDATGMRYNRQSRSRLRDDFSLKYDHGSWKLYSYHTFMWNNYTYTDAAQATQHIFRYNTELQCSYEWKHWRFALAPRFILNEGYHSHVMNGGQFLLNANIRYKFLKNRAELFLDGSDLLNQAKRTSYSITATSHTESGQRFMHQYVSLSFTYRIDPRAK